MKPTLVFIGALGLSGVFLSSCGGGGTDSISQGNGGAGGTAVQSLDTAQVLAQAKQTSETNEAYRVNDGALTFTDTSDTTDPIATNAT